MGSIPSAGMGDGVAEKRSEGFLFFFGASSEDSSWPAMRFNFLRFGASGALSCSLLLKEESSPPSLDFRRSLSLAAKFSGSVSLTLRLKLSTSLPFFFSLSDNTPRCSNSSTNVTSISDNSSYIIIKSNVVKLPKHTHFGPPLPGLNKYWTLPPCVNRFASIRGVNFFRGEARFDSADDVADGGCFGSSCGLRCRAGSRSRLYSRINF